MTTEKTLPERIRETLKQADVPFVSLKTSPNFRYTLVAETEARHELEGNPFTAVDWAKEYSSWIARVLGEMPESFRLGEPKADTSQAGNWWRCTILIKAVGYTAPKREKLVQLELPIAEPEALVPVDEPEVVELVKQALEEVIVPEETVIIPEPEEAPVEKPKRVRKPGIKKAAKESEDTVIE